MDQLGSQAERERKARADERRLIFEQEMLVRLQDALDEVDRIVEETGLQRFPSQPRRHPETRRPTRATGVSEGDATIQR
jgi:hypothetical protein